MFIKDRSVQESLTSWHWDQNGPSSVYLDKLSSTLYYILMPVLNMQCWTWKSLQVCPSGGQNSSVWLFLLQKLNLTGSEVAGPLGPTFITCLYSGLGNVWSTSPRGMMLWQKAAINFLISQNNKRKRTYHSLYQSYILYFIKVPSLFSHF